MESSAFIISGPVRMDLHFKCMLNVISKLELIETLENVDTHSSLVEAGMGWPIQSPAEGAGIWEAESTAPPCLNSTWTLGRSYHPSARVPLRPSHPSFLRGINLNQMNSPSSPCSKITRLDFGNPLHHAAVQYANQPKLVIGQSWWEQFSKLW